MTGFIGVLIKFALVVIALVVPAALYFYLRSNGRL